MLPSYDDHCSGRTDSKQRIELEILRGRSRNKRRVIEVPAYLIGSAHDCDLVLGDPQFPEVYAYLRQTERGLMLRQIGVGPELTVNGAPMTRGKLHDGDRIRTGPYEFQIHIETGEASVPQPPADELDPVEEQSALLEVQALLREIHDVFFPPPTRLRLYIDPEMELREANLRAAALWGNWNRGQRRWGGF